MVACAPTEDATEGEKANHIAALSNTVKLVPGRGHGFVLTDTITRRGEGGMKTDNKVLGAYGRDVLNENGNLLLGFAEDNKFALLYTFFSTPKRGV